MIEAVGATLAPFTKQEKPKVSTRLAVSLIKKGPRISGLRAAVVGQRADQSPQGKDFVIRIGPSLLDFRDRLTQRNTSICSAK